MHTKQFLPEEIFYDEIAEKYDNEYNYNLALAENEFVIDSIKKENIHTGKVLDLGCGTGLFLDYIDKPNDEYYGIDISNNMLNKMKNKHPESNCEKMNISDISKEFRTSSFDNIVSLFGSMAYVPNPAESINNMYNLLKENGKFFIMLPTQKYVKRKNYVGNKFQSEIKLNTYTSVQLHAYFYKFQNVKITGFNLFAESLPEKYNVSFYKNYLSFEQKIFGNLIPFQHYYLLITGSK